MSYAVKEALKVWGLIALVLGYMFGIIGGALSLCEAHPILSNIILGVGIFGPILGIFFWLTVMHFKMDYDYQQTVAKRKADKEKEEALKKATPMLGLAAQIEQDMFVPKKPEDMPTYRYEVRPEFEKRKPRRKPRR